MDWLAAKIDAALGYIAGLVAELVGALFAMLSDAAVAVLELFLNGVEAVVGSLPVPSLLTGGLQGYLNGIDPAVLYFLSQSGFSAGMALVGAGFAFRMLRKLFTLGQW